MWSGSAKVSFAMEKPSDGSKAFLYWDEVPRLVWECIENEVVCYFCFVASDANIISDLHAE